MPMFDLDSDDPETTVIQWHAGEGGEVGIVVRGGENVSVDLGKGEQATLWWRPARAEDA